MRPALYPILFSHPGWVLPGASIDMDFANGRYFGGALNNNVSVSRASTGYAQTAAGVLVPFAANVLRVTDQGALIEEARTNLALYSQNFTVANWNVFGTGVSKVGVSPVADPAGGATAYEVSMGTTGGAAAADAGAFFQNISLTAATYTLSVFVRAKIGTSTVRISITQNTPAVTTGTADTAINDASWTRISLPASMASSAGNIAVRNNVAGNSGNIYVAFAQAELGSFPTSYIPTTTASATRAADVPSLMAALNAKSAFFQTREVNPQNGNSNLLDAGGGGVRFTSPTAAYNYFAGGGLPTVSFGSGTTAGVVKVSAGFDANGVSVRANGGTLGANASSGGITSSPVYLGNRSAGDRALNGYMQRFALSTIKGVFDGATTP